MHAYPPSSQFVAISDCDRPDVIYIIIHTHIASAPPSQIPTVALPSAIAISNCNWDPESIAYHTWFIFTSRPTPIAFLYDGPSFAKLRLRYAINSDPISLSPGCIKFQIRHMCFANVFFVKSFLRFKRRINLKPPFQRYSGFLTIINPLPP